MSAPAEALPTPETTPRSLALYPYVSMRPPEGKTPLVHIGDSLAIALLHIHTQGFDVLYREDVQAFGLDACQAYLASRLQLTSLVKSGKVTVRPDRGPWDSAALVFEHRLLAASCVVLPDLYAMAEEALHTDRLCIAIPRRDRMMVFPDMGQAFRAAIRDSLRPADPADGECPIFALEPSGPAVVRESMTGPAARRSTKPPPLPKPAHDHDETTAPHDILEKVAEKAKGHVSVQRLARAAVLAGAKAPLPGRSREAIAPPPISQR